MGDAAGFKFEERGWSRAPRSRGCSLAGGGSCRPERAGSILAPSFLVILDGLFKNADNQRIERGFVFLRPTGQLLMKHGWHANLEVDHGFRHGIISSFQKGPAPGSKLPGTKPPCARILHRRIGACIGIVPDIPREFSLFSLSGLNDQGNDRVWGDEHCVSLYMDSSIRQICRPWAFVFEPTIVGEIGLPGLEDPGGHSEGRSSPAPSLEVESRLLSRRRHRINRPQHCTIRNVGQPYGVFGRSFRWRQTRALT
jgi:hypothetical protein